MAWRSELKKGEYAALRIGGGEVIRVEIGRRPNGKPELRIAAPPAVEIVKASENPAEAEGEARP